MSSFNYLDKTGLATLWGKIKSLIPTKISEFENDSEYITDLEEKKIVSGSVVNFSDGMDVPVKDLVVGIEPVQSGSGDPSPTNVRPISGWTGVTVTVTDGDSITNTYTVNWSDEAGTVYGGSLNVTTGVLTVTYGYVDLGSLNWGYYENSGNSYFAASMPGAKTYSAKICSKYFYAGVRSASDMGTQADKTIGDNGGVWINVKDSTYTDATTFKTAMDGVQLCYELETPTTYQLTATEVSTLLGYNNIYANTGDISLTYYTDSHATTAWVNSKLLTKQNTTVIQNKTSSDTTITLSENTFYIFPEMATLTIICPTTGLYSFRFTSGTTATTLSITGITMPDGFTVETNKTYEISVYEGYGVATSWAVESNE